MYVTSPRDAGWLVGIRLKNHCFAGTMMGRTLRLCALCLIALAGLAECQFGQQPEKPIIPAVKSDLPYIRCGVCEAFVRNAFKHVEAARAELKPGAKVLFCLKCCNLKPFTAMLPEQSHPAFNNLSFSRGQWISARCCICFLRDTGSQITPMQYPEAI